MSERLCKAMFLQVSAKAGKKSAAGRYRKDKEYFYFHMVTQRKVQDMKQ